MIPMTQTETETGVTEAKDTEEVEKEEPVPRSTRKIEELEKLAGRFPDVV